MAQNLLDVFDGSEIKVEVAKEYDEDSSAWQYTTIAYRRNISPDMPDATRAVYDRLTFKGNKMGRGENTLEIEEEFQGFDTGLYTFKETDGCLVKVTIDPNEGSAPSDNVRYYTNWCPTKPSWSAPDEGEFNVTLSGRFDSETDTEPDGSGVDWANTV